MKKFLKKILCLMLPLVLACGPMAACVSGGDDNGGDETGGENNGTGQVTEFDYEAHMLSKSADYNTGLFYVNTLDFDLADPAVIYITEGTEKGYFYAYGTSDAIDGNGFQSWRSKDATHWEAMGIAYKPDFSNTWTTEHHWAPEVLYENGLYYMFYSAMETGYEGDYGKRMSVAVSSSPAGPFAVPDGQRDADGKLIPNNKPVYEKITKDAGSLIVANTGEVYGRDNAIDIHPFIDPVSGKKYLYWSAFASVGFSSANFGIEMKDWFTPKYETLTQVTQLGKLSVGGANNPDNENGVNEGPFIWYDDGKYYLTFSVYGFRDALYQVRQAVSTQGPLGPYTKLKTTEGGVVISTLELSDKITSAGHHSFFTVGDELFIAYHTFKDRDTVDGGRALAIDPVRFVKNSAGARVMRAMGASYSMQPLPEGISGYKNIAASATVTSNKTSDGSDVKYLNDGLTKYQWFDNVTPYESDPGTTEITFAWNDFKTARAILVYNSVNYDTSFVRVENIEMTYLSGDNGATKKVSTGIVDFDWDWHLNTAEQVMRPGGAVIAEFDELPIKEIKITIKSPEGAEYLEIPEIIILGKDTPVAKVTSFKEYTYTNPEPVSAEILINSANFSNRVGGVKGTWGFDVSHDTGNNAYISNEWAYDQHIYFKGIFATKFYAEAELTVTKNTAYPYRKQAADPYPKFGLVVTAPKGSAALPNNPMTASTAFFFVDAVNFTTRTVGIVERNTADKDWAWPALTTYNPNVGYTNGNYIKMAILRDGKDFYFFVNGNLVFSYDNFTGLTDDALAAVGIRCFSTPLKAKSYSATTDAAIIAQKLAALV